MPRWPQKRKLSPEVEDLVSEEAPVPKKKRRKSSRIAIDDVKQMELAEKMKQAGYEVSGNGCEVSGNGCECEMKEEKLPLDLVDVQVAWQNIVSNHVNVFQTTELENWVIDSHVPTFDLPSPWMANVCIIVFPSVPAPCGTMFHVAAFCRTTRQCLIVNEENELFKVHADELFRSKYIIVADSYPKKIERPANASVFPFVFASQTMDECILRNDETDSFV